VCVCFRRKRASSYEPIIAFASFLLFCFDKRQYPDDACSLGEIRLWIFNRRAAEKKQSGDTRESKTCVRYRSPCLEHST
jgi:hypothetical protein